MHEAANVLASFFEVEKHVADTLAGAVIGVATAAARVVDWKVQRIEQLGRIGTGPRGEQRRMLEQPHELACGAVADRRGPLVHERERFLVRHGRLTDAPLYIVWQLHASREMASALITGKGDCVGAQTPA